MKNKTISGECRVGFGRMHGWFWAKLGMDWGKRLDVARDGLLICFLLRSRMQKLQGFNLFLMGGVLILVRGVVPTKLKAVLGESEVSFRSRSNEKSGLGEEFNQLGINDLRNL